MPRQMPESATDAVNGDVDRLSDLPDSLIFQILCYLPTKDAVATSVLRRRWRFLWTYVQNLYFDFSNLSCRDPEHDSSLENFNVLPFSRRSFPEYIQIRYSYLQYGAVVRNVMSMHNAVDLDNFRLIYRLLEFSDSDLDEFVSQAVERGVKNLEIGCVFNHDKYLSRYCYGNKTPVSMLNCRNLVTLRLRRCFLWIPCDSTICLPSLKELFLDEMLYPQSESLPRLISGCPALEELTLRQVFAPVFQSWRICSETLKCLNLELSLQFFGHEEAGFSRKSYCQRFGWEAFIKEMKTPSLVCLNLWCQSIGDADFDFPFSIFGNVPSIKRLKLHLDSDFTESAHHLIPAGGLHSLEVLDFSADSSFLMLLMSSADNLKELIVHKVGRTKRKLYLPKHVPECLVTRLETVTFVAFEFSEFEFSFLEYILENALLLEKVTVCCRPYSVTGSQGVKKLQSLKRRSNEVQIQVHACDPFARFFFGCDVLSL